MFRRMILVLAAASVLLAANVRLHLKDGSYHIVREYKVLEDRVRYYSVERGDWEEIPLELIDLKKTESEISSRKEALKKDAAIMAAEEKAEREQERELSRIPQEPGVYLVDGDQLRTIPHAESKVVNNKRRSILKAITPIPILSGKASVELDGANSKNVVTSARPEFYIRLSAEERFGIAKLIPNKDTRIVQKWDIIPVTKEIMETMESVDVFRRQLDDALYKIWPEKPLEPGEYAVVQYTEGKGNLQVWDFRLAVK
jgi:hypothetical protein